MAGITLSSLGKDSWIDFKLLGGVMICSTPYVEDSGHIDFTPGMNLIPSGPYIVQPSSTLVPAWGLGVEARPSITNKIFFLVNANLIVAFPTIKTTQQITYFDQSTYSYVTQTSPCQYKLNITTVFVSAGVALKL